MKVGRLLGVFTVLVIMTSAGQPGAWAAPAGGTTIGPVQISTLGHPGLCWEAGGNGSAVTLEHCDRMLQGQQWSLTPDGVLMNGNGYCLEAVPGSPLLVDFASQCAGTPSQRWHYRSGRLVSPVTGSATGTSAAGPAAPAGAAPAGAAAGTCAVTTAPVVPGAEIVGAACPRPHAASSSRRPDAISPRAASRWSIGYSAVSLTASRGQGSIGGMFGASVTVANAASAQAAYGVSVTFALPPGVAASSLHAVPGSGSPGPGPSGPGPSGSGPSGSGLHCDVSTLTCTGTVPAGASGRITLTGPVPAAVRPGDSYPVRARASVTGTIQRSRTAGTTASLSITVSPAASHPRSPLPLIAAGAALLLLAGLALLLITRRGRLDQPVAALRISP